MKNLRRAENRLKEDNVVETYIQPPTSPELQSTILSDQVSPILPSKFLLREKNMGRWMGFRVWRSV